MDSKLTIVDVTTGKSAGKSILGENINDEIAERS